MAAREEKKKEVPPTPPRVLYDKTRDATFQRLDFLGEVCFSLCHRIRHLRFLAEENDVRNGKLTG